ncbi:MAG: hypothetical protein IKY07_06890, partial [Clostridia bacterium]|nr:hypothetical protein [Clostridia bacterium]
MKKSFCILPAILAAVVFMFTLTSCGLVPGSTPGGNGSGNRTGNPQETPEAGDEVVLEKPADDTIETFTVPDGVTVIPN